MGPQAVSSLGLTLAGGGSVKDPELPWALDTLAKVTGHPEGPHTSACLSGKECGSGLGAAASPGRGMAQA